jgi:glycosyltransferase involved in cell wall biosynthesis
MGEDFPKISLCMIARDEEAFIGDAIRSVFPIVSEVIVVDTGSVDRTKEIVTSLGAKVFDFQWINDFAAARNFSLTKATGDWILVLDGDEAIAESDLAELQRLTLDRTRCTEFLQRHYSSDQRLSGFIPVSGQYPKWEREHAGYFESNCVRLFPNREGLHFQGRVHELVEHSIYAQKKHAIIRTQIRIHHYGHTSEVRNRKNKTTLYTPLGENKLKDNPNDWKNFFELGVEHNQSGRHRECISAFKRSIELNPYYLSTWVNLGYALCELKEYEEAEATLNQAIKLDRKCFEAYCNLGVVYMRTNRFKLAEQALRIAIKLKPDYINALCNLGKTLATQNRLSESILIYKKTLRLMPTCLTAITDLKTIYLAAGKPELINNTRFGA